MIAKEKIDHLISQWKNRAKLYSRLLDLESDPAGVALLQGKFFAYFNCANELAEATNELLVA